MYSKMTNLDINFHVFLEFKEEMNSKFIPLNVQTQTFELSFV